MRFEFLFSGVYEDIIQTLAKWRILDLQTLRRKTNYDYSYQAFAKKVSRLEKAGFLGKVYFHNYRKYLYLTDKGLHEAGLEKAWAVNPHILQHDIISVNVFEYFLTLEGILGGGIHLDGAGRERRPDCYVEVERASGETYSLALEIELSQKGRGRIEEKFSDYLSQGSYNLVLYIFQKAAVFEAYKRTIEGVDLQRAESGQDRAGERIALMIEPEIKHKNFDLMDSICCVNGKIKAFKEIWRPLIGKS
ncbi:MAG: hypothetical protein OXB88_01125 [Bacteriovoracales bacterium]|nr:hypothetical protein [Bacteriovoracales bacterium]